MDRGAHRGHQGQGEHAGGDGDARGNPAAHHELRGGDLGETGTDQAGEGAAHRRHEDAGRPPAGGILEHRAVARPDHRGSPADRLAVDQRGRALTWLALRRRGDEDQKARQHQETGPEHQLEPPVRDQIGGDRANHDQWNGAQEQPPRRGEVHEPRPHVGAQSVAHPEHFGQEPRPHRLRRRKTDYEHEERAEKQRAGNARPDGDGREHDRDRKDPPQLEKHLHRLAPRSWARVLFGSGEPVEMFPGG